jgi:hypothetical protein
VRAKAAPRSASELHSSVPAIPLCVKHHRTGDDSYQKLGPRKFAELRHLNVPAMVARLGAKPLIRVASGAFMFPKGSVIRYDFAAYGNMPALKVFWYDGLKETPKIPGVPEGEWLGDPPSIPGAGGGRGGRGAAAGGQGGPPQGVPGGGRGAMRPAGNDFHSPGRVFNWEEFAVLKDSTTPLRFPIPDGSVFMGDKGMLTTGTYGDVTRLIPIEKMQDYRMPPPY